MNQNTLRETLRDFLKRSGYKQTALSLKLGLAAGSLASFKRGYYNLSEEKAKELLDLIETLEKAGI